MTFSMSLDTLTITVDGETFTGTIYSLAQEIGEPMPTRITATAEYTSMTSGSYTMTILYTNGQTDSESGSFDDANGLNFGFL